MKANRHVPFVILIACVLASGLLHAGGHTWRIKEFFSNADGTIQYIEAWEANGTPGETATANHKITSLANMFNIPNNVPAPTTNKSLLFATQAFADLGVVTPDYIIPSNYFSLSADSISYTPFHTVSFLPGMLPTDGVMALNASLVPVVNSPSNYAGQTGSVNVPLLPPAVPGSGTPLTVLKSGPMGNGATLRLFFDTSSCSGDVSHQVIYGFGSGLPTLPGGLFGVAGSSCSVASSPFVWTGVPDPTVDPSRLLWFLMLATDGSDTEGGWGHDSAGSERLGAGAGGSSGQCGMTDKSLDNACGN